MSGRAWRVRSLVSVVLVVSGSAAALPVAIDPGAYGGYYVAAGTWHHGPAVVELPVGPNALSVAFSALAIDVASDGTVTSQNPAAAAGGPGTLSFNTTPVQFEVGLYRGSFVLGAGYASNWLTGPQTVNLPPGLGYSLDLGVGGPAGTINVAGDGTVSATNTAGFAVSGATIHFNTVPVQFDVGLYRGYFVLGGGYASNWLLGAQSIDLVPGAQYYLNIGYSGGAGSFAIASDGSVSVAGIPALSAAGTTLHFNTTPVQFNVGLFRGAFQLPYAARLTSGSQVLDLPPGLRYGLGIGGYGVAGYLDVAADGSVTSTNPAAVQTSGSSVSFRTTGVSISPASPTALYTVSYVLGWVVGAQTLALVPGVEYQLSTQSPAAAAVFAVGEPCSITPAPLVVGTQSINISCASMPTAVAGADQNVPENSVVALDGSASTGDALSWQWTQIAGPAVSLANAQASTATFTAPSLAGGFGSQVLTFSLTVSNALGSSTSNLNVTVSNVNHAPVAHATAPALVSEGSAVLLDGTATWDPDGDPLTYLWEQTAGPPVVASATTPTLSFNAPLLTGGQGGAVTLQFRLTASDGALSSTDLVSVQVEQVNHAPVAVAGAGRTVTAGAQVTLDGRGSTDPDGDLLLSQWSQVSGPAVALTGATTAQPSFTPTAAGAYVFSLVVSDGLLSSAPSLVTIAVTQPNLPPDCSHAVASPAVLWPPNHKLIPVQVVGVTDPVHSPVSIAITGVLQDEATGELDRDDTNRDAVIRGSTVLLRAEREERGDGRVYVISFRATDGLGNVCTGTVTSTVPKSLKPHQESRDSGERHDSTH